MPPFTPEEAARIAALARLGLEPEEAARLAADLERITRAFSDLAAYAATLAPASYEPAAALRKDEVAPADEATVEAILRAVPRLDASTRAVRAPRGPA